MLSKRVCGTKLLLKSENLVDMAIKMIIRRKSLTDSDKNSGKELAEVLLVNGDRDCSLQQ